MSTVSLDDLSTWTRTETLVACAFAFGITSFLFVYLLLIAGTRNDIVAVKRLRTCIHSVGWMLVAAYIALLYFELVEQRRIEWPHLGVVRPVVCVVLGCFYFFTTTHPAMRWVALLLSATTVVCNTLSSAELRIVILCRRSETCTNRSVHSLLMLELQYVLALADIVFGTVMFMFVVTMCGMMGWWRSYLPPRLFDSSVPMSFVPESSGGTPQLLMGYSPATQRGMGAYARNAEMARGEKLTSSRPGVDEYEEKTGGDGEGEGGPSLAAEAKAEPPPTTAVHTDQVVAPPSADGVRQRASATT